MIPQPDDVRGDPKVLPRDKARFRNFAPNGAAKLRDDATTTLAYVTSYQMVVETEAAQR